MEKEKPRLRTAQEIEASNNVGAIARYAQSKTPAERDKIIEKLLSSAVEIKTKNY